MKKSIVFLFFGAFLLFGNPGVAQTAFDTIVTKSNESIVCKITKITEDDVEYKKDMAPDAIIYVISKSKIRQIRYSNGLVEVVTRDEMDMNAETEILDKRSAIKFHFFSPFRDFLGFTYEKTIKMGTNIETSLGYINTSMFDFGVFDELQNLTQGAYISAGAKFNLGNSYYMKGMKYSHPLKGRFFKPEISYTGFTIRDLEYDVHMGTYPTMTTVSYNTDKKVNGISLMLNYGNQYILGNIMTFGFSVGVGYSFLWTSFTNQDMTNAMNNSSSYYSNNYLYSDYTVNMFNHLRAGDKSAIAFTSTITLGYILK